MQQRGVSWETELAENPMCQALVVFRGQCRVANWSVLVVECFLEPDNILELLDTLFEI